MSGLSNAARPVSLGMPPLIGELEKREITEIKPSVDRLVDTAIVTRRIHGRVAVDDADVPLYVGFYRLGNWILTGKVESPDKIKLVSEENE